MCKATNYPITPPPNPKGSILTDKILYVTLSKCLLIINGLPFSLSSKEISSENIRF